MKSRPYRDCIVEYEASVRGYSQWAELKKQFEPGSMAIVELVPPVVIDLLWGVLWGLHATGTWVLRGFGIELKKHRDSGEPAVMLQRLRGAGQWLIAPKNISALSIGLVALAVSYYYFISLPAANRQRLQFEKDAAAAANADHDRKEEAAQQAALEREVSFGNCSADADTDYRSHVELNGKEVPGKSGTHVASTLVWNAAEKRKADALAECHRQYDPRK